MHFAGQSVRRADFFLSQIRVQTFQNVKWESLRGFCKISEQLPTSVLYLKEKNQHIYYNAKNCKEYFSDPGKRCSYPRLRLLHDSTTNGLSWQETHTHSSKTTQQSSFQHHGKTIQVIAQRLQNDTNRLAKNTAQMKNIPIQGRVERAVCAWEVTSMEEIS